MSAWAAQTRDECLRVFLGCQARWDMPFRRGSSILEIGCAEADWLSLAKANVPDAVLIGVDHRPATRPGRIIQGDVRDQEFAPASLDWVVLISALEHIGLGRYGDPVFSQGDRIVMELAHTWLKTGGHLYFDVPWTPDKAFLKVDGGLKRIAPHDERWRGLALDRQVDFLVYDDAHLEWLRRQPANGITRGFGWTEQRRAWMAPGLVDAPPETVPGRGWVYRACWWTKIPGDM